MRDAIAAERRQLPWVKVDTNYVFDGPDGKQTLAELFAGRSQLIVYHFMFGEGWEDACPSCAFVMDHIDGALPHLNARDVTFVASSNAPRSTFDRFRQRMGWKFKWVSAHGNSFNADFHVAFTKHDMEAGDVYYNYQSFPAGPLPVEEFPGVSVFVRRDDGIFHTYSTYARGLDILIGAYNWLDLTFKGRDEEGLAHHMAWVRPHDRYDNDYHVDANAPYGPPKGSICAQCAPGALNPAAPREHAMSA